MVCPHLVYFWYVWAKKNLAALPSILTHPQRAADLITVTR
jgi:hypothetical protein